MNRRNIHTINILVHPFDQQGLMHLGILDHLVHLGRKQYKLVLEDLGDLKY